VPDAASVCEFQWGIRSPELDGIVPWPSAGDFRAGVILEKWSGWARWLPWNWAAFHGTIIQGLRRSV